MDLRTGLWLQQTQKLAMTQELSQAIALLQFSTIELVHFLDSKALENPLLLVENINERELYRGKKTGNGTKTTSDKAWIEQIGDLRFSLTDHLNLQLNEMNLSTHKKKVVQHIISHLDDNGYFTGNLTKIAKQFNISDSEAEDCLALLQELDPVGIGARSLQECLLLQVCRQVCHNQLSEVIIADHFKKFADKKWKELAKILGIEIKEIQQVFDDIQSLNPKPGSAFHYERASYIVPDVIVVRDGSQLVVQLSDNVLPKIQFNQSYFNKLSSHNDPKVADFLHDKELDVHWVIRSLEQRQKTIVNVTGKIVEKQQPYFEKGPTYLKPMTMREISEELGIHESTVSRAVREKYVQTPFGTVELRSFFTSAIESVSDEALSSSQVKTAMAHLFQTENKQKPLSDLDMVQLLKDQEGIVLSRRTVAKYREQLGIPASSKRKRYS